MNGLARSNKSCLLLAAVLVIAAFFRFYLLTELPPGLYDDEAISGVEAQRALETGDFAVYYEIAPQIDLGPTLRGTFGTEGLYINLVALSIKLFGNEPIAIRAVSAFAGVLTVLGLFLLARALFVRLLGGRGDAQPELAAAVAAYLLAVLFWHVNFSRIGFHAILMPCVSAFSFYFLFRGMATDGRRRHFILAGLFLGLGFHTYISFRIAPLVAILAFLMAFVEQRSQADAAKRKNLVVGAGLFVIFAFIAALPMLVYFVGHTDAFLYRAKGLSLFAEADWPLKLVVNFLKALGQFNFAGDNYQRHNIAGAPELPWTMGAFFLVGVAASILRIIASLTDARATRRAPIAEVFLLFWLVVGLIPAALAISPHPHALRSLGAALPAVILSAFGMAIVYEAIKKRIASASATRALAAASVAFLVITGALEYKRYFRDWANSPELGFQYFDQQTHDIARFMNSLPTGVKKFAVVNYRPETVQYLTDSFTEGGRERGNIVYLFPERRIDIDFQSERPYVVIPLADDEKLYRTLMENVPGRFVREKYFDYIASE